MYTRKHDLIFAPQRIMPHLFSQNAAKGSNFTSCRHCRVDVKIIKRAKKVKYLGLLIDEDIKWDEHVAYISSKIRQNLGVMEWLSNDNPLDSPVT